MMVTMTRETQEHLLNAAADIAREAEVGKQPSPAVVSLLAAIAATEDEAKRHELAGIAHARAGALTDVGLQILRVAVFALAV